ncbi:MAG: hypothetical protein WAK84_14560 [Candidatus Cybelea sp.]
MTTPMRSSLLTIVPLIPSGADFAAGLAFFVDHMSFKVLWQADGIAGIARDNVAFNLVQNDDRAWATNASFSIGVSNLADLYREYLHLPAKVGPLEVKPWGRREFHVIIPSGVCLQFYETES